MNKSNLLSVLTVATKLNIHRTTVNKLITDGKLPAVRIGEKIYRIRESDLDKFLSDSAVSTAHTKI